MWNKRKTAGLLIAFMMMSLLGGCGKKESAEPAPELLAPLSQSQSFRPVEKRYVGGIQYLQGRVLAKGYAHFFTSATDVAEILVDYGDEVQEGDVIARADTRDKEAAVRAASEALSAAEEAAAYAEREYEAGVTLRSYQKAAADAVGDTERAAAIEKENRVEAENYRYRSAASAENISWLEKDLQKAGEELEKGTLVARHSGTVTYVADLSQTQGKNGPDNVLVLISDFDDLYIEAIDDSKNADRKGKPLPTNKYFYRAFENKYTMIGGKKYPITELDYTQQEQRMIKTKESYPGMRFLAEGAPLTAGSTVPLYFSWEGDGEPVLAVGLDSVQTEGETSYVYVRKAPGSEETERRVVELGTQDKLYAEVLSGLSEGEEVYYEAGSVLPAKYDTVTVEQTNFTKSSASERITRGLTKLDFYYTPNVMSTIIGGENRTVNTKVEEGDYLYTYAPGTKDSELLEASQAVAAEDRRHTEQVSVLNAQLAELDKAIAAAPDTASLLETDFMTATDTDAEEKEEILYSREKLTAQRSLTALMLEQENAAYSASISALQKEYDRLRSISGEETVNAKESGEIRFVSGYYGDYMAYNNTLMAIIASEKNSLVEVMMVPMTSKGASAAQKVNAVSDAAALPGQKVKLEMDDGQTWDMTCVGINGDGVTPYVTSIGDKIYLPVASPRVNGQYDVFYASIDPEAVVEGHGVVSFDAVDFPDVLVIPAEAVYTEASQKTSDTLHYVWRIMPYGLDKTYVDVEMGGKTAMVLSGLSAGDQVAVEVVEK